MLEMLEENPVTPDEVASALGMAWATAQGILLRLEGAGKVRSVRKGRVNVYFLKDSRRTVPPVPSWAHVKDLDKLSKELEPFFAKSVSSSEMIRRERRD